jgi:hypothetical protein
VTSLNRIGRGDEHRHVCIVRGNPQNPMSCASSKNVPEDGSWEVSTGTTHTASAVAMEIFSFWADAVSTTDVLVNDWLG